MKLFLHCWIKSFAITSGVMLLFNGLLVRWRDLSIPYVAMTFAAFLLTALIALSITLFKMKKGNDILKTILGLLVLLPIPLILRRVYGVVLFRFTFVLLIFFAICAISYAVAIVIVSKRAQKATNELNQLLNQSQTETTSNQDHTI